MRRSQHSGADFEAGRLHGRNGEQPTGDDRVEDAREETRNGLDNVRPAGKKRAPAKTMPARMGKLWATVEVVGKHYENNQGYRQVRLGPGGVCVGC